MYTYVSVAERRRKMSDVLDSFICELVEYIIRTNDPKSATRVIDSIYNIESGYDIIDSIKMNQEAIESNE
jgi:hypothetical protein